MLERLTCKLGNALIDERAMKTIFDGNCRTGHGFFVKELSLHTHKARLIESFPESPNGERFWWLLCEQVVCFNDYRKNLFEGPTARPSVLYLHQWNPNAPGLTIETCYPALSGIVSFYLPLI